MSTVVEDPIMVDLTEADMIPETTVWIVARSFQGPDLPRSDTAVLPVETRISLDIWNTCRLR
jgi:hypothetical protein